MTAQRATLTADAAWVDLEAVIAGDYKGLRVSHTFAQDSHLSHAPWAVMQAADVGGTI